MEIIVLSESIKKKYKTKESFLKKTSFVFHQYGHSVKPQQSLWVQLCISISSKITRFINGINVCFLRQRLRLIFIPFLHNSIQEKSPTHLHESWLVYWCPQTVYQRILIIFSYKCPWILMSLLLLYHFI